MFSTRYLTGLKVSFIQKQTKKPYFFLQETVVLAYGLPSFLPTHTQNTLHVR